jgi:hypothetical protein
MIFLGKDFEPLSGQHTETALNPSVILQLEEQCLRAKGEVVSSGFQCMGAEEGGEGWGTNSSRGYSRVGVSESSTPALDGDDCVATLQNSKLNGPVHSPLQSLVDIDLPADLVEVGLLLRVVEGVDAAGQVRVPRSTGAPGDHDNRARGAVFRDETSGHSTGDMSVRHEIERNRRMPLT